MAHAANQCPANQQDLFRSTHNHALTKAMPLPRKTAHDAGRVFGERFTFGSNYPATAAVKAKLVWFSGAKLQRISMCVGRIAYFQVQPTDTSI